jgi:hypothetical protein
VLYQLSYCPSVGSPDCTRAPSRRLGLVAAPRRRALGLLFLGLAALFVVVTVFAVVGGQWIIAVAAGVIGVWMADLAYRTVR